MIHYENLRVYLRLGLKQKKYIEIRIPLITMIKTIYSFQYTKKKNKKRAKIMTKMEKCCTN